MKQHIYFRQDYAHGSDYEKFYDQLTGYTIIGPNEHDDAPDFEDPNLIFCDDCGEQIVETQARNGQTWTPENIRSYSKRQYGRCLCAKCQKAERASRGGR